LKVKSKIPVATLTSLTTPEDSVITATIDMEEPRNHGSATMRSSMPTVSAKNAIKKLIAGVWQMKQRKLKLQMFRFTHSLR